MCFLIANILSPNLSDLLWKNPGQSSHIQMLFKNRLKWEIKLFSSDQTWDSGLRMFSGFDVCMQDWERCEKGIGGSLEKLRAFKRQLSQPLPDHQEELHSEEMRCRVHATFTHVLLKSCVRFVSFQLKSRINKNLS